MENLFDFSSEGFLSLYFVPTKILTVDQLPEYLPNLDFFKEFLCKDPSIDYEKDTHLRTIKTGPNKTSTKKFKVFPVDVRNKEVVLKEFTYANKCNFIESIYLNVNGVPEARVISPYFSEKEIKQKFTFTEIDPKTQTAVKSFSKEKYKQWVENWKSTGKSEELLFLKYSAAVSMPLSKILSPYVGKGSLVEDLIKNITAALLISEGNVYQNDYIQEITGEAIPYFYNVKNYVPNAGGNLGSSCMRESNSFTRTKFYEINKGVISLLVLFDKKETTKIRARAILWKSIEGEIVVDRIYYCTENDTKEMKLWLNSRGIKSVYARHSTEGSGLQRAGTVIVKLHPNCLEFEGQLPYLDSMAVNTRVGYASTSHSVLMSHVSSLNSSNVSIKTRIEESFKTVPKSCEATEEMTKGEDDIVFIKRPSPTYTLRKNTISVVSTTEEYLADKNTITEVNKKYNHFREILTLVKTKGKYKIVKKMADKQHVVYSRFLKKYLLKDKDVVWDEKTMSYYPKELFVCPGFVAFLQKKLLVRRYSYKVVRLNIRGKAHLISSYSNLPFTIGLSSFRKSRSFCIKPENITSTGVILNGIEVPFNCITVIKQANGKSKKQDRFKTT